MFSLASSIRQHEAENLLKNVLRDRTVSGSWIIQGMPGCGSGQVFNSIVNSIRASGVLILDVNVRNYWTGSVSRLLRDLTERIPDAEMADWPDTLSGQLAQFRNTLQALGCKDRRATIAIEHFDAVLKFDKSEEVQDVLNTFQTVGSADVCRTTFIVNCHRDIEDICARVNYSDFYKLFGSNHHRVKGVHATTIAAAVKDYRPDWTSGRIDEIARLSAGIPEHVEVIMRCSETAEDDLEQESLDSLSSVFREWVECLSPGERDVLKLLQANGVLGPEHLFDKNKLKHKALLTDSNGDSAIRSPLFRAYLGGQSGTIQNGQKLFIKRSGDLQVPHQSLLHQLFPGWYYLEWDLLQSFTEENATVYRVKGEDSRGVAYRPAIVKIDRVDRLEGEIAKTSQAKDLLGPLVPAVVRSAEHGRQMAMVQELATGDNRDFSVRQFEDFYRDSTGSDVASLLRRVFCQALFPLYQNQKMANRRFSAHYYLPRHQEYSDIVSLCERSSYYDSLTDGLRVPGFDRVLPNPGKFLRPRNDDPSCAYYRLFGRPRPVGLSRAHGDLNPRNLLIDGIGNIHLIDFTEMKDADKGTRFLDLARLEAEIKFRLTRMVRTQLQSFVSLEQLTLQARSSEEYTRLSQLPLTAEAEKMLLSVVTLRRSAMEICTTKTSMLDVDYEYKLGLLGQSLRIALFGDYLDEIQREFAVISAAFLVDWLLVNDTIEPSP